jgi:hypothetical protein
LLLQAPEEYLAFIQQGSISVAVQKEGMFQKGSLAFGGSP